MSQPLCGPPTLHQWFRLVGWTADAWNYPRSPKNFAYLCAFNGIPEHMAPRQWRYASNAYMLAYVDRLVAMNDDPKARARLK